MPCLGYIRYNALTTSIMNRGKLLHSGMTSLHSFEPAAERFCAWLSDIETTMQALEVEADKVRQTPSKRLEALGTQKQSKILFGVLR